MAKSGKTVNSATEAIEALGGTGAVAKLFGIDPRVVSNWRMPDRRLPAETYVVLKRALKAKGFTPARSLWRMYEAANDQAAAP